MLGGKWKRELEGEVRRLGRELEELRRALPLQLRDWVKKAVEERLSEMGREARAAYGSEVEDLGRRVGVLEAKVEAIGRQLQLSCMSRRERGAQALTEGLRWQREVRGWVEELVPLLEQRLEGACPIYPGRVRVHYSEERGEPDIVLAAGADVFAVVACRAYSLGGSTLSRSISPEDVRPELWEAKRRDTFLILVVRNTSMGAVWISYFQGSFEKVHTPTWLAKPEYAREATPERAREYLYHFLVRGLDRLISKRRGEEVPSLWFSP